MTRHVTPFGEPGHFYEGPRWRDGRWWLSDMRGQTVLSYGPDQVARIELNLTDDKPSGLGWLPDGSFLVVSMDRRQILRRPPASGAFEVYADLGPLVEDVTGFLNDMHVTKDGHAYVGFDADYRKYPTDAGLGAVIHVDPEGHAEVAARGLNMPNGIVVTPDGSTLVVAETMSPQFTSYPIGANGALGAGEVWARFDPPTLLDGCWMDAEGCIWAADTRSAACLRVARGGEVVDRVFPPEGLFSFACALGGPDGRTLMICAADMNIEDRLKVKGARLFTAQVDVPGL